jgi:type IV pilus assembly protein PilY1
VFSDPVVVAAPKERFDVIYNDKTYAKFYNKWAKRRGTVYVGGNDGMLHAFNTGYNISTTDVNPTSDKAQITFCTTLDAADPTKCGPNDPSKALGKEMWGFIPPDVLPHLAWMADPDYLHTYYVDNMVRVTDARIFADDADHPNGWGTILLVSLRFGGAEIDVTDTFGGASTTKQFKSAYYCLDVTNPDVEPKLLWRFTDKELGFSLSTPTIVREEDSGTDHWYAVLGSGPSNYRGARAVDNTLTNTKFTKSGVVAALPATTTMSTTNPHLYIMNLATGQADSSWTAGPGGRKGVIQDTTLTNRFYTSVTAVDYPLDFKYDMIYYGSVGCNSGCSADGYGTWGGRVSRVKTNRDIDPGKWVMSDAFLTAQPITVKPAVGVDQRGNIWVYVGTGRFLHIDDRIDATAEYYYGFKDTCYHSGCTSVITNGSNILDSSSFTVNVNGTITPTLTAGALGTGKPSADISRFEDLSNFMRDQADGWKLRLAAGERVIVNGFVVGGIAGFGSFTPSTTVCEFEGRSRQYYPYYLTGTVPYIPGGTFMYSVFVDSGGGLPSVPAVHIDAEGNVKLFLQKSTGEIQVLELKQAQSVTGGLGAGGECTY